MNGPIKSTKELGDTLHRLLNTHFVGQIGADHNLAYVRSWTTAPGLVTETDIVRIEENGVLAVREDWEGRAQWGPIRGRPADTVAELLALNTPTIGFDTMPGGWWWGLPTTHTEITITSPLPRGSDDQLTSRLP